MGLGFSSDRLGGLWFGFCGLDGLVWFRFWIWWFRLGFGGLVLGFGLAGLGGLGIGLSGLGFGFNYIMEKKRLEYIIKFL